MAMITRKTKTKVIATNPQTKEIFFRYIPEAEHEVKFKMAYPYPLETTLRFIDLLSDEQKEQLMSEIEALQLEA